MNQTWIVFVLASSLAAFGQAHSGSHPGGSPSGMGSGAGMGHANGAADTRRSVGQSPKDAITKANSEAKDAEKS